MLLLELRSAWRKLWDRLYRFVDYSVQAAGPAYTILAVVLISSVIYIFFSTILPTMYDVRSFKGILHTLFALCLIVNVFYNFFHCVFTDPGSPKEILSGVSARWCKHCQTHKPPFTHHCHICKRCILKMDHHCPWMHNCIGFYNYRFFFVFMLYLWIGCGYGVYVSSMMLYDGTDEGEFQILFTFAISLALFCALFALISWHIYLILTGQSTVDFYANRQRSKEARARGEVWINEYDLGVYENLRSVFNCGGRFWWLALFLPCSWKPIGDGLSFRTKRFPHRQDLDFQRELDV